LVDSVESMMMHGLANPKLCTNCEKFSSARLKSRNHISNNKYSSGTRYWYFWNAETSYQFSTAHVQKTSSWNI